MKRVKSIILCWDFITITIVLFLLLIFAPEYLPLELIKQVINIYITILAITFSLFFAAFAIIISSNDDSFMMFLEDDKIFSDVLWTYKFTLYISFITLILSVADFIISCALLESGYTDQYYIIFVINTALFLYSTFSIFNSIKDSIKFIEFRLKFLKKNKE